MPWAWQSWRLTDPLPRSGRQPPRWREVSCSETAPCALRHTQARVSHRPGSLRGHCLPHLPARATSQRLLVSRRSGLCWTGAWTPSRGSGVVRTTLKARAQDGEVRGVAESLGAREVAVEVDPLLPKSGLEKSEGCEPLS